MPARIASLILLLLVARAARRIPGQVRRPRLDHARRHARRRRGPGPHAAVVLVPESGPVDRDISWGKGNGTYRELAKALTEAGFATLRYDPRGVPPSGGSYLAAGLFDFASDATSAVAFLKSRKEMQSNGIFVAGLGTAHAARSSPRASRRTSPAS